MPCLPFYGSVSFFAVFFDERFYIERANFNAVLGKETRAEGRCRNAR